MKRVPQLRRLVLIGCLALALPQAPALAQDPEARRFLRELEKSGVRSVVDRSLLVEMKLE
jgi:hypothetical protein